MSVHVCCICFLGVGPGWAHDAIMVVFILLTFFDPTTIVKRLIANPTIQKNHTTRTYNPRLVLAA